MAKSSRRWCADCQQMIRSEWSSPNHILHLLLSLVTFGLWLPVWFVLGARGKYQCTRCGAAAPDREPPRPRTRREARYKRVSTVMIFGGLAAVLIYGIVTGNISEVPPFGSGHTGQ